MAQSDFIVKNGAVILNGSTATSTSTTTGALIVHGGIATSDQSTFGGTLNIINTAQSVSSTTGALVVSGGVGIQGDLYVQGVNLLQSDSHAFYVSDDGEDTQTGKLPQSAVRTIARGLELAGAVGTNAVVNVLAGQYREIFPLTVPAGVSVKGAGLRQVYVYPTTATNTQSAFLLNGETSVSDFTVGGFYKPGYAFKFAPGAKITTRSPYVERFSVLTKGSNPTANDPYGYDSDDAGGGAYLDGANVDPTSLEAAFLFNEATFIVPSSEAVHITNGTRVELLNGFSYFADKGIVGISGSTGWGGTGRTRLRLANSTGTFTVGNSLHYVGSSGELLATGVINEVTSEYIYLTGKASGFVEAADRSGKTVTPFGNAEISSYQRKFGTASAHFTTDGDLLNIVSDTDLQYGFSSYTTEAWIYLDQNNRKQYIVNKGNTAATTFGMWIGADNKLAGQHGTTAFTATTVLSTGTWFHVMMTRDLSNTNRLFVNGTLENSTSATASISNSDSLTIGGYDGEDILSLRGYLDEIRISTTPRYISNFTVPATSYSSDISTTILVHADGLDGSVNFIDDGLGSQNVYSTINEYTDPVVASAQQISLADYRQFGGELRSIGSAVCYGNYGIYGDGEGIDFKAIAFNMSYIGSGKDLTNDPSLAIQANEITRLNGAKIYFQTVDHLGDFRVGPEFRINQRTGNVDFGTANFRLGPLSSLTISDGVNTSVLQPTSIQVGQLLLSGSSVQTVSGNLTLNPAGSLTTVESDLQVNGALNFTGQILATSVENAVSTVTGAIVVSGGIGLAKDLWVGGNATVKGNLTVGGTTTIVNSTQTSISDPVLDLGTGPDNADLIVDDGLDRGLLFHYNTSVGVDNYTRSFLGLDNSTQRLIYKVGVSTGTLVQIPPSFETLGSWGTAKFGTLILADNSNGSTSTGSLQVAGGGYFTGNLYVNKAYDIDGVLISAGQIENYAVTQAFGGTDINVESYPTNPGRGVVTIHNTSTLQSVTYRGSSTNIQLGFTNQTESASTDTGAVVITGGLGVGGTINATNIYSNGFQVVTVGSIGALGVTSMIAGTDTAVSTSTGAVVIWNTSTLQTITDRGSETSNQVVISNTSVSTSTITGALVVGGGVGIQGNLYAGDIYSNGIRTLTTETDTLETVTSRGSTTPYSVTFANTAQSLMSGLSRSVGIDGGLFVAKKLYVNESVTIQSTPIIGAIDSLSALNVNGTNKIQSWFDPEGGVVELEWVGPAGSPPSHWKFTPTGALDFALGANGAVFINGGETGTNFVGINTPTPTAQLEVNGDIKANNIYSNGSLVITNATLGTYGVTSLTTGSGLAVNTSSGAVIIESIDTLELVTSRGNTTLSAINILNAAASTSTTTGALIVAGGVGIAGTATIENVSVIGNLIVESLGITKFLNPTDSTAVNSGSVLVSGGMGVIGSIYAGAVYDDGHRVVTEVNPIAGPGITITDEIGVGTATSFTINNAGVIAAVGTPYIGVSSATGIVTFTNLGVHRVLAGADIAVNANTGSVTVSNTSTLQTVTSRGSVTNNAIGITNALQSTGTLNGALTVAGGVGVAGNLNVGGNAIFAGTVTFNGTATYVYSTNTIYTDNLIELHTPPTGPAGSWTLDDGKDIGVKFRYYANSTDTSAALVLANDTKYLEWYSVGAEGTGTFVGSNYGTFKTGAIKLANGTSATNTTSGDLTVAGGAGIGGNLYVGGLMYAGGLEVLTTSSLGSGGVGVSQIYAGTDTVVSANFGSVTVWNTSNLQTITDRGFSTTNIVVFANGESSTNNTTGAVRVIGGIGVTESVRASSVYDNGSRVITTATIDSYAVTNLQAGADISVSTSVGAVIVANTSTLQSVTSRGATTNQALSITNSTISGSSNTGALTVVGGAGIGKNITVGQGSTTRGIENVNVFSNGSFTTAGDAQSGMYILRAVVASTASTTLTTNEAIAGATNQVILANNASYMFKVMVTAKAIASNNEGAWEFNGSISRYSGPGTTVMRVANKTKIWSSFPWDVNVVADTVNGGLSVQAIGTDTSVVRFVAKVETVEVTT